MVFAMMGSVTNAVLFGFLVVVGFVGLTAVVSPTMFARLSSYSNRWVDTSKAFAKLDKSVNVEPFVMSHSRLLGAMVVVAVGVLGYLLVG